MGRLCGWFFPNTGQLLPPGKWNWQSGNLLLYFLGTIPRAPNKILQSMSDYKRHPCRHTGLQRTTQCWTFLQNSFVNTETDFHEHYFTLEQKVFLGYKKSIFMCHNQEHKGRIVVGIFCLTVVYFYVWQWTLTSSALTCHNRITSLKVTPVHLCADTNTGQSEKVLLLEKSRWQQL